MEVTKQGDYEHDKMAEIEARMRASVPSSRCVARSSTPCLRPIAGASPTPPETAFSSSSGAPSMRSARRPTFSARWRSAMRLSRRHAHRVPHFHVGDVMVEHDGDLRGDGVNIVTRLEGIAKWMKRPRGLRDLLESQARIPAGANVVGADVDAAAIHRVLSPGARLPDEAEELSGRAFAARANGRAIAERGRTPPTSQSRRPWRCSSAARSLRPGRLPVYETTRDDASQARQFVTDLESRRRPYGSLVSPLSCWC